MNALPKIPGSLKGRHIIQAWSGFIVLFLSTAPLLAQSRITTIAGGRDPVNGGQATGAAFGNPNSVAPDGSGGFYFSVGFPRHSVYRVAANGTVTIIAGNGRQGFSGDGGAATSARLSEPHGLARDGSGNLFIVDNANHRVRKVTPAGIISTVAGIGTFGYSGDGGPATSAQLNSPWGVAIDGNGNLLISDTNNQRIRKISAGVITTVVGTGTAGFSGDNGPAVGAQLRSPRGIALDGNGNLLIADTANHRIRRVTPAGIITTVAGTGSFGFAGDNGLAINASLSLPSDVAVDGAGDIYIADTNSSRIRRVNAGGVIVTIAGVGNSGSLGDGGPAGAAGLSGPSGVAVDFAGNLFIADRFNVRIRRVVLTVPFIINTVAGIEMYGFAGDGFPAASAALAAPLGLLVDGDGNLLIADTNNHRIRLVTPGGIISTFAGTGIQGFSGDGGPATAATLINPTGIARDTAGNVYITDCNDRIRKVDSAGSISRVTTFAWSFCSYYYYDYYDYYDGFFGGEIAVDSSGNLIVADTFNYRIRKVSPEGVVTVLAGTNSYGFSGDGGPATSANLSYPRGIALDPAGNIYFVDSYNNRVRKITPEGIITTVAGGTSGFSGDGGPALSAQLNYPSGLAIDASANLYIADTGNNRIRKVTPDGIITTVAGDGYYGSVGDGGAPSSASLASPIGVAVDPAGNLYIADTSGDRIRKVQFALTVPTVTEVYLPVGAQGTAVDVTLSGTSFTLPLTIDAGSGITVSNIRVLSETVATATFTIAATAPTGNRNVNVTTSLGRSGNVAFSVEPPFPDLSISSSGPRTMAVGFVGTLSINIVNKGIAATSDPIAVTDTLPTGLTFVSGTGTDWSCSAAGQAVTCNNPAPLAPNASTTLNLNIAAAAPAALSSHSPTVTVGGDLVSSNNSTSVTTIVVTPVFTISSVPASPQAGTQASLVISMNTVLSHEVTGKLTLRFTPDAVHPADDPAIQFATGGREVAFRVPENGGQAQMGPNRSPTIVYQTGTIAGSVTFDATLETGSNSVTVSTVRTILRRPPTIQSVRSQRMSDAVNLLINSTSTPREITTATLTFSTTPPVTVSCGNAPGCTAATNSLTLDVRQQFDGWFSTDRQYGSTSMLTLPLTIQGSLSGSVSVTLRNAQGNSNSMSIPLP